MNMRFYILSAILILLGACRKAEYDTGAYGGLSLYNASYTLNAFLPASTASQNKVLVPLAPAAPLAGQGVPFFSTTSGFRQDFPDINWRNEIPWAVFDHYTPGAYTASVQLSTTDSVSGSRFTFPVQVEKDRRRTYFLSDSLGVFHATMMEHEQGVAADRIMLRLVQLCPDADSVNLRIGSNLLTGIQNLPYRSVSGAIVYPLAADSTLKLRIFNAGDTLAPIARTDLQAAPGQSYLLILRNYSKPHQYTDKNGNTVNIIANGTLDVRKVD